VRRDTRNGQTVYYGDSCPPPNTPASDPRHPDDHPDEIRHRIGSHWQMRKWETQTTVPGAPSEVLELLTEPAAIARWAPVPFEVVSLDRRRLRAGSRAQVAGRLAGCPVEFDITVFEASGERLALAADGPISIDVQYVLRPVPGGSDVRASVSVDGQGLFGRVLAKATEALLAAGALRTALERLGRQLELAPV
jgi:Polyketide cyclase / dehydrase and lipid transport